MIQILTVPFAVAIVVVALSGLGQLAGCLVGPRAGWFLVESLRDFTKKLNPPLINKLERDDMRSRSSAGSDAGFGLPLWLVSGWGIVAFASACLAPWGLHQSWLVGGLMVVGGIAAVATGGIFRLIPVLLLALPLAAFTAQMPAVMFDEFAQWLPNTRFLVEHDAYWLHPAWIGLSDKPGYPNGTLVISLMVSKIAGQAAVETAFKVFMTVLMVSFGWCLAAVRPPSERSWWLVAVLVLVAVIDPFFDPRIALTSYADAPSGFVLAVAAIAAAKAVRAARDNDQGASSAWFGWAGLCCATLVSLKATNLVLVGLLCLAAGLSLAARRRLRGAWCLRLAGPFVLMAAIWRIYLKVAEIGPDIATRPFGQWHWLAPVIVLRSLFIDRLLGNPLLAAVALACAVALALGVGIGLWRRKRFDDNPLLFFSLWISGGFVVFLGWAYIAVFSADEVSKAASAWRYVTQLGPLLTVALVTTLPEFRSVGDSRRLGPFFGGLAVMAVLAAPLWGRSYFGVACRYPDVVAARATVTRLASALAALSPDRTSGRRLAVYHPSMGDWMAHALAYDLRWPVISRSIIFQTGAAANEQQAWDAGAEGYLDLSGLDRATLSASGRLPRLVLRMRPGGSSSEFVAEETDFSTLPRACGEK